MNEIWIAFSGKADIRLLRLLRPGFRHCFALMRVSGQRGGQWLFVDSMLHRLEVRGCDFPVDFDMPRHLRAQGYRVIRAPRLDPAPRFAGIRPFTCVEAMKRLIGLDARFVFTPWQLYRHLVSITRA
ncbi:MAG: hypothetical protein H6865_05275 [Rhodospirillales bacterium]|nr:hypothetical protein [Alphaproteobacteria bacterium]MCB9987030.1 hypothetical protein [Rhodospirillales bacterium]USO08201.1 MAG: hypothetical protein H6866_03015 [Rhodospirillales bacterium]